MRRTESGPVPGGSFVRPPEMHDDKTRPETAAKKGGGRKGAKGTRPTSADQAKTDEKE